MDGYISGATVQRANGSGNTVHTDGQRSDTAGNTGVYLYTDASGTQGTIAVTASELKLLAIVDHPVSSSEVILHH